MARLASTKAQTVMMEAMTESYKAGGAPPAGTTQGGPGVAFHPGLYGQPHGPPPLFESTDVMQGGARVAALTLQSILKPLAKKAVLEGLAVPIRHGH